MKKQKKNNTEVIDDNEVKEEVVIDKQEEQLKPKIKKTIFYIFYDILATICVVLLILTFFDKPKDFILDKVDLVIGLIIIVYAVIFLLPYTLRKKEAKIITVNMQICCDLPT